MVARELTGSSSRDDEIDFMAIMTWLYKEKRIIILCSVLSLLIVFSASFLIPNVYRAEVVLAPVNSSQGGGVQLPGEYAKLAGMAGINLGSPQSDRLNIVLAKLESKKFLRDFIDRHDLVGPLLFASRWDKESNRLIYERHFVPAKAGEKLQLDSKTEWKAYKRLKRLLTVTHDTEKNLVVISIEYISPYMAKRWVDWIVQDINNEIKKDEVLLAQRSVDYLQKRLQETNIVVIQGAFGQVIQEQLKTIMMAEVSTEYALSTIDPAIVPQEKARPQRLLFAILGGMLGAMIGGALALLKTLRHHRAETRNLNS